MQKIRSAWRNALLLSLCAPAAQAGRPMAADDAAILDPRQCQLETWTQHSRAQDEYWAVPACNFGGGWELAAGAGRTRDLQDSAAMSLALLQAKTMLRAPQDDGWGLGLVLADQFRAGSGGRGDLSLNLPLSVELAGQRAMLHANLGWLRQRGRQDQPSPGVQRSWALGLELAAGERAALTLEAYGRQRAGSYVQLGARYSLVPGRADIDIGYGDRAGRRGAERYLAIGLTLAASLGD
ncbi:hypothetical protein ASD15_02325 [Massilia sp. Root351]|jgi:hypothetical protein|uniref:hypothetical protein n=1 Tax=Massilia sp. Root351 TaxID=1736522 RepID=UPI00070F6CC7|nr:hypothetical protein [Massilia sp. Root351]KQV90915.1 hypothetical protein ASD15_02325 [Massilia sp. Root351]